MKEWKPLFKETAAHLVGQAIFCSLMLGLFALMGNLDRRVLLGALVGGAVAVFHIFLMGLSVNEATKRAMNQDVARRKRMLRLSYPGRMIVVFAVLSICADSGLFHPLALAMPLAFTTPILMLEEILRKRGTEDDGVTG